MGGIGARWRDRVRSALGIRRGVQVEGVYYKELTAEPLARALAEGGTGHKDYRVTFPDGEKRVIRCSPTAVYADLMGPVGVERLGPVMAREGGLKPGARVLEVDAGTGYRALWLSFAVGPSGSVVALCTDKAHAEFAARRYQRGNISFETVGAFALSGETDGSFDAVVALELDPGAPGILDLVRELWRVQAGGGRMLLGSRAGKEALLRLIWQAVAAGKDLTTVVREAGPVVEVLVTKGGGEAWRKHEKR
jgi:protein-L-isoaspartate O-methyltransferase